MVTELQAPVIQTVYKGYQQTQKSPLAKKEIRNKMFKIVCPYIRSKCKKYEIY